MAEEAAAVGLALVGLYGLGVPLAWLLPAPAQSQWVHRIAVAPLLAIVAASASAWILRLVDLPLRPTQLWLLAILAWLVALRRTGHEWQVRDAARSAGVPLLLVSVALLGWLLSLQGYGLFLPNSDFPKHAFWVAQVASNASADPGLVLRASAIAEPSGGGTYPLGLHTVLGWLLPSADWDSTGVTAASAVLTTAVSMPLGFFALARFWSPTSTVLAPLAGFAAVALPGLTWPFGYGSVTLMAATATFPAALLALWTCRVHPSAARMVGLAVVTAGLWLLHIAEAVALVMIALAALPTRSWLTGGFRRLGGSQVLPLVAGLVLAGAVVAGVVAHYWPTLVAISRDSGWDYGRSVVNPLVAPLNSFFVLVWGHVLLTASWIVLFVLGVGRAARSGLSGFPLRVFLVAVGLTVIAMGAGVPTWMQLITAPWYGQGPRIALLAGAPLALYACLALEGLVAPRGQGQSAVAAPRPPVQALAVAGAAVLLLATVAGIVPDRRGSLGATLAGAGDTGRIADELRALLEPGETVLGFEGDGTELLYAYSRVPVHADAWLADRMLDLSEAEVAAAMRRLAIRYIAVGTTSMYWGPRPGYGLDRLLEQPELDLALSGTDMVVMRYQELP